MKEKYNKNVLLIWWTIMFMFLSLILYKPINRLIYKSNIDKCIKEMAKGQDNYGYIKSKSNTSYMYYYKIYKDFCVLKLK